MKFIHQCHRVLRQDALAQPACAVAQRAFVQCVVQAPQHVGKAETAGLLLQQLQAVFHVCGGVRAQGRSSRRQAGQGCEQGLEGGKVIGPIDAGAFVQRVLQAARQQTRKRCAVLGQRDGSSKRVNRPGAQGVQPAIDTTKLQLAAVENTHLRCELSLQPGAHGGSAFGPAHFQLRQCRDARRAGFVDALGQAGGSACAGKGLVQQALHVTGQCVHVRPGRQRDGQRGLVQRIDLLAPVVAHGLVAQGGLVGLQFFVEQAAAVEGVFTQHALAPGVDGEDGRVVHALGRHRQAPSRLFTHRAGFMRVKQRGQKGVVRRHLGRATEAGRRLHQALADAVRQFTRGSLGEAHHQDFLG